MEEKSTFQWTPAITIVLIIVAIAMILPLALMGYGILKEVQHKEISTTGTAIVNSLRESVEAAAKKEWDSLDTKVSLQKSLRIKVESPEEESRRISAMVERLDGKTVLSLPDEKNTWEVLIQLPKTNSAILTKFLLDPSSEVTSSPGEIDSSEEETLELILEK